MKVQVKTIFAMEQYVGGEKSQELDLDDGSTLADALLQLIHRYGPALEEKLLDGNALQKGMVVYVNGRNSLVLDYLDTPLEDGDDVLIMPPVGGG
ncbi:MoaD family protein [Alkalibacter rhizosphaerae]|uniref:MoaD family protein n=1 Tax=Alkalibacter rhizosphaerae TaxID=2815577 RepID=A0A974XDK6_9FIRM|nr:MoaD family protein [Alkalibacter rhizosphaerae]QSX07766.1 MoaD family protein [Alkalibacter rhizosphaerae]